MPPGPDGAWVGVARRRVAVRRDPQDLPAQAAAVLGQVAVAGLPGGHVQEAVRAEGEPSAIRTNTQLERSVEDLEWSDGRWSVQGSPESGRSIQELGTSAWVAASLPDGLEPHGGDDLPRPAELHVPVRHPRVRVVEVDPETGRRRDRSNDVAVDDCGNVINPMIVDGQVHGGVARGWLRRCSRRRWYGERRPAADRLEVARRNDVRVQFGPGQFPYRGARETPPAN